MIGQLAKNEKYKKEIEGDKILAFAEDSIFEVKKLIGLRTILVECEDQPKLIDFYSRNGFVKLQKSNLTGLIQMTKIIK